MYFLMEVTVGQRLSVTTQGLDPARPSAWVQFIITCWAGMWICASLAHRGKLMLLRRTRSVMVNTISHLLCLDRYTDRHADIC